MTVFDPPSNVPLLRDLYVYNLFSGLSSPGPKITDTTLSTAPESDHPRSLSTLTVGMYFSRGNF